MTDFESASNQALTGALLSLSIGVCFREQISKIKNFHLSGSIWIALMFYFLYGLSSAVLEREYAISPPSTSLFNSVYVSLLTRTILFAALSYHTSYRALILLFPQMEQRLWLIAGAVAFIEFSLNIADGVLFIRNLEADFGMIPDPNEQRTSITLMVYVISTDTIFFLDSQARIITGMADGANTKVLAWHYLDAFLRCVCYSGAVFLYFVTSGGVFYPTSEAWIFLAVSPSIMFLVLLTDAARVSKLVSALQQTPTELTSSVFQSPNLRPE